MLRRPAHLNVESLRPELPTLTVVTHKLTKRQPNGLPEPDYNQATRLGHPVAAPIAIDVDVCIEAKSEPGGQNEWLCFAKSPRNKPKQMAANDF
jgi:hypothetical protein